MKEVINKKIIQDFMEDNKLTKTMFCKLCGISISTFNKVISNQNFCLSTLCKISRAMDIPPYKLCL